MSEKSSSNNIVTLDKVYIIDENGDKKNIAFKVEDENSNIKNGEGAGSIKQRVFDNDAKNPIAYGLGSIAFGGFRGDKPNNTPTKLPELGNTTDKESNLSGIGESTTDIGNIRNLVEDGRYYEEDGNYKFKNIISDTRTYVGGIQATAIGAANRVYGNWSFAGGKDNVVIGKSGFAFGNGNVVSAPNYKNGDYAFTAIFGASNISTGSHSLVSGENNTNTGNWSIVAGKGIKNEGKFSAIFGGGDTSGAVPFTIHNVGQGNLLVGYSLESHSYQFDIDCNQVSLLGRTLRATNGCQTIVGRNNSYAVQDTPNLRFAVATGCYKHKITGEKISTSTFDQLSDTDKANYEVVGDNGLEVYEGGSVYVYKKPTTPSEVARLTEINELNKKIENLSGADIDLSEYVKNTDYASKTQYGLVKLGQGVKIDKGTGLLFTDFANESYISAKSNYYTPITPAKLDYAVKVGMTTNKLEWTEEEKASARNLIGAVEIPTTTNYGNYVLQYQVITTGQKGQMGPPIPIKMSASQGSIAQRGVGGTLSVGTPTEDVHAVPLAYLNTKLAELGGGETLHKIQIKFSNAPTLYIIATSDAITTNTYVDVDGKSQTVAQTIEEFIDKIRNVYVVDSYNHKAQANISIGEHEGISNVIKAIGYIDYAYSSGNGYAVYTIPLVTSISSTPL